MNLSRTIFSGITLCLLRLDGSHGFVVSPEGISYNNGISLPNCQIKSFQICKLFAYPPRKNRKNGKNDEGSDGQDDDYDPILDEPRGRRGDGSNWIEKSSPTGIGNLSSGSEDEDDQATDGNYDLGIEGISFQTGDLSTRMYDALMSVALKRFPAGTTSLPSELEDVYMRYALDITAKEAVKAALEQNGLELAITSEEEDEGLWGDIDLVQLIDTETGKLENEEEKYFSLDEAVEEGDWVPGQTFNFVVRNVPARLKEMDISDLLQSLDPSGEYRDQAKEKGIALPDEDIATLRELGKDCDRRVNTCSTETKSGDSVYTGDESKGYNIINRSDLLQESGNPDGTENSQTLMHVMDALVNHGCLIVDLSDSGANYKGVEKIAKMWETTYDFYNKIESDDDLKNSIPTLGVAEGSGSEHAVSGLGQYKNGNMKFLETRSLRCDDSDQSIIPHEVEGILGADGVNSLIASFREMADIGSDIVRIAVAAANLEYEAFEGFQVEENTDLPFISGLTFEEAEVSGVSLGDGEGDRLASEFAAKMAKELIDDGSRNKANEKEGLVSMSPHRLCFYSEYNENEDGKNEVKETFGAHTDTSFVTIVPAAKVNGLEVFDEGANEWFRPELLVRKIWEREREEKGLDPTSMTEVVSIDGENERVEIPWYSRYAIMMPGELLQIVTRNEVCSAVHRVICVDGGEARFSAPILLRARSGMKMDLERYFGREDVVGELLSNCDGMRMEEIHNALQPSSYRNN